MNERPIRRKKETLLTTNKVTSHKASDDDISAEATLDIHKCLRKNTHTTHQT